MRVLERLKDFLNLKRGWCEGDGEPFNPSEIERLSKLFSDSFPSNLPQPYVYPDLDDTVRFEWEFGHKCIDMDVCLKNLKSIVYKYDLSTDDSEECELDLSVVPSWEFLKQDIIEAMG